MATYSNHTKIVHITHTHTTITTKLCSMLFLRLVSVLERYSGKLNLTRAFARISKMIYISDLSTLQTILFVILSKKKKKNKKQ